MEKKILKELSKKYARKEEILQIMFAECKKMGYNIEDFKNLLQEFYKCY